MIHTIQFNLLSAMALDFVDYGDGFLYLRMVGTETVVNAIWARLSAKDTRGKKWSSEVNIPIAGRSYPEYVATQKRVTYRTLRSRVLPSGMVDLAIIHPRLTVAEDNERGFYLLSYETGIPPGFFERLNKTLSIPLKPEWAAWLWEQGQNPQSRLALTTKQVWENGQSVEKTELTETTEIPISRLNSLGQVACYRIQCDGRYRDAWLQLIRQQLALGLRLKTRTLPRRRPADSDGQWILYIFPTATSLYQGHKKVLEASSLNYVLTEGRETLGLHFIIEEGTDGSFSC